MRQFNSSVKTVLALIAACVCAILPAPVHAQPQPCLSVSLPFASFYAASVEWVTPAQLVSSGSVPAAAKFRSWSDAPTHLADLRDMRRRLANNVAPTSLPTPAAVARANWGALIGRCRVNGVTRIVHLDRAATFSNRRDPRRWFPSVCAGGKSITVRQVKSAQELAGAIRTVPTSVPQPSANVGIGVAAAPSNVNVDQRRTTSLRSVESGPSVALRTPPRPTSRSFEWWQLLGLIVFAFALGRASQRKQVAIVHATDRELQEARQEGLEEGTRNARLMAQRASPELPSPEDAGRHAAELEAARQSALTAVETPLKDLLDDCVKLLPKEEQPALRELSVTDLLWNISGRFPSIVEDIVKGLREAQEAREKAEKRLKALPSKETVVNLVGLVMERLASPDDSGRLVDAEADPHAATLATIMTIERMEPLSASHDVLDKIAEALSKLAGRGEDVHLLGSRTVTPLSVRAAMLGQEMVKVFSGQSARLALAEPAQKQLDDLYVQMNQVLENLGLKPMAVSSDRSAADLVLFFTHQIEELTKKQTEEAGKQAQMYLWRSIGEDLQNWYKNQHGTLSKEACLAFAEVWNRWFARRPSAPSVAPREPGAITARTAVAPPPRRGGPGSSTLPSLAPTLLGSPPLKRDAVDPGEPTVKTTAMTEPAAALLRGTTKEIIPGGDRGAAQAESPPSSGDGGRDSWANISGEHAPSVPSPVGPALMGEPPQIETAEGAEAGLGVADDLPAAPTVAEPQRLPVNALAVDLPRGDVRAEELSLVEPPPEPEDVSADAELQAEGSAPPEHRNAPLASVTRRRGARSSSTTLEGRPPPPPKPDSGRS